MREYRYRASSDDLEKSRVSKDMIKRAVTISANHLSTRDYEGIVKGVRQINLMYSEPEPQAAGSDVAKNEHVAAVVQSGRNRNAQASASRPRHSSSPRRFPTRQRDRAPAMSTRTTRSPGGSTHTRVQSQPRPSHNSSRQDWAPGARDD